MSNLQSPQITWNIKSEIKKNFEDPQKTLIITQSDNTNNLVYSKAIKDEAQCIAIHGQKSLATLAYKNYKIYNEAGHVDIIGLKSPSTGNVNGKGTITTTGTATSDSTLTIKVIDDNFDYEVAIDNGDTNTAIATKIAASINANTDLPITAAVDGTTSHQVNVTFTIPGTFVNDYSIYTEGNTPGVTFATGDFSAGAGTYTHTNITKLINERYQTVIFDEKLIPVSLIKDFMDKRFNETNIVNTGSAFSVLKGTLANLITEARGIDSKTVSLFANTNEMPIKAFPIMLLSEFAAKRSKRLTERADIKDITIGLSNPTGGLSISSLPYHATPMSYTAPETSISLSELTDANEAGLSFLVADRDTSELGSMVTTYKTNREGKASKAFKYLNSVDISSAVKEIIFKHSKARFGQARATTGTIYPDSNTFNGGSIMSFLKGEYLPLAEKLLVEGGQDAQKFFENSIDVQYEPNEGKFIVNFKMKFLGQLREIVGDITISI